MMYSRGTSVLMSVLDWGLGHATRTSVIVGILLKRGCRVTLAGSGRSLELLRSDYPELQHISLPSFSPTLSRDERQWVKIAMQLPTFLWSIWRERRMTKKIVSEIRPDLIISDNRYGVRDKRCRSVIITHQLRPKIGKGWPRWVESFVAWTLCRWIREFDGCLVPDVKIGGLSGELSGSLPQWMIAHRIGVLSRLVDKEGSREEEVDWLGIVSGPEPQRAMLEEELTERFGRESGRRVVVCGRGAGHEEESLTGEGVEKIGYADARRLKGLIMAAKHIVCRSGYSTIMDLAALGKRAELIPTPGQGEQEYLAERLNKGDWDVI